IDTVERGLNEAWILPGFDFLLEGVPLGASGDLDQGRHPIERSEHIGEYRSRFDHARPPNDRRSAVAALIGFALLALERRDSPVRKGDCFRAIICSEDDNRVVEFAHVLELLEDIADIVVQLLLTGFLDSPILASLLAQHSFILR